MAKLYIVRERNSFGAVGDTVQELTATIPIYGDLYGDISRSAFAVAEALARKGYLPRTKPIQTGTGFLTGAPKYGKLEVNVKKAGQTFDAEIAKSDIASSASGVGLKIGLAKDWYVQLWGVSNPLTVTTTTAQGVLDAAQKAAIIAKKKKEDYDACIAAGGNVLTCTGAGAGIPTWVWWAGGGAVVLFGLVQLATVKKAFLGEAPSGRSRRLRARNRAVRAGRR